MQEFLQSVVDFLQGIPPIWIFLAIAILPAIFFPVSPLLIAAAAIVEPRYAYVFCLIALGVNMVISYYMARLGRSFFFPMLEKRGISVKDGSKASLRMIMLIRITPGVPFPVQNYLLGVMGVPFGKYFIISLAVQALYTYAFVIIGKSIFAGEFMWVIVGVILLILLSFLFSWWKKKQAETEPESLPQE